MRLVGLSGGFPYLTPGTNKIDVGRCGRMSVRRCDREVGVFGSRLIGMGGLGEVRVEHSLRDLFLGYYWKSK